nr:protein FAR1-RELATED SEQUENCE 5-like [Ipomoea batatas]
MDSASGGFDEGYSTDIGEEGSACDMEISPCMTKYWRTICANSLKPHVGQQFDSLDSALGFYKQYAGSVGFDCMQSTTRKGRDGGIVLKHVGRSGEYSTTGRFPLSFGWISGGVLMNFLISPILDCAHNSSTEFRTSRLPNVGFSSCGCGWGGTSACGMDVPSSSGGAFSSCKALSM